MSTLKTNRTRMLEAPVGRTLASLAAPMVIGMLAMVLYNITDTFFVARLGKDQIAALTFTFPVVLAIASLSLGIGMGASAAVSRAIGRQDWYRVRRLATDSLILGLLIIAVGVMIGFLTINSLFSLLGAHGTVLDFVGQYMRIWYFGMIFVVVPIIGNNILRATGDTKTPGLIMVAGAVTNAVLDPIMIFGMGPFPALGIQGAALATLIGRGTTFLIAIYVLAWRERLLIAKIPHLREIWDSWRKILHVGIPNAATKMIIPFGQGIMTRIVASFGIGAVAGYGVGTRIEFFSLAALNALASVIGPFVGQNIGAGNLARVRSGFAVSRRFSLYIGLGFFLTFAAGGHAIARLFNSDPMVVSTITLYLRITSLTYAAQGFYLVVNAGLNVLKRPLLATGLSLFEIFGLAIPLALLGSKLLGYTGVFSAIGISYLITGVLAWVVIEYILNQHQ